MPLPDRLNTNNNARPLKPTLATNRTAKTPVAPRLAASSGLPTVASQPARRPVSYVAPPSTTATPAAPRVYAAPPDDLTPVKPFLGNNITPRSSSRKSRVGGSSSAQSTPNLTPTPTPRPPLAASHYSTPQDKGGNGIGGRDTSPMFFHASESRGHEQPAPQRKAPMFFYANGEQDSIRRPSIVASPHPPVADRRPSDSKFFHADLTPENVRLTQSPEPESWNNSMKSLAGQYPSQPPSPSKENIQFPNQKGTSQPMRPPLQTWPSALSAQSAHSHGSDTSSPVQSRRVSLIGPSSRFSHQKSASLSSVDMVTSPQKTASNDLPTLAPSPLQNQTRAISDSLMGSIEFSPTETTSAVPSPRVRSPTKSSDCASVLDRMNELAANARRERKVLDLEISNSSLLAINRSLEKEVRKQKAELRRFRRMSRAGRFSVDPTSVMPGSYSTNGAEGFGDLSDMSEEEKAEKDEIEDEEQEEQESSSESSFDENALSPSALAEHDAAHEARDEKRLQLDLAKHRELLLDSQKMNQSLKRCLNWTEELIKDGQKALQYRVNVSDVKLGGRVLISEDDLQADHDVDSKGLLSPWTPQQHDINPLDEVFVANDESTDRDSGVDLDGLLVEGSEFNMGEHESTSLVDGLSVPADNT